MWEMVVQFNISGIFYQSLFQLSFHNLNHLIYTFFWYLDRYNTAHCYHIGSIMIRVLATGVVDRAFESRSAQTKVFKIGICCYSAKHAVLISGSKDWLALNQEDVSEWSDMSILGLLFQRASTIAILLSLLVKYKVKYKADIIIISSKCNLFSPCNGWKCDYMALNNNHSLTHGTV